MAFISHKHKFMFVHTPRTGGTSIEETLHKHGIYDDTYLMYPGKTQQYHEKLQTIELNGQRIISKHSPIISFYILLDNLDIPPSIADEYFKFAVVRNPWDLYVSWFKVCLKHNIVYREDFEEFITCASYFTVVGGRNVRKIINRKAYPKNQPSLSSGDRGRVPLSLFPHIIDPIILDGKIDLGAVQKPSALTKRLEYVSLDDQTLEDIKRKRANYKTYNDDYVIYNFKRQHSLMDYFIIPNFNSNLEQINKNPVIDYYIRFENLKEDFSNVMKKLNINDIELLHINNTKKIENRHYREYYNETTKNLVYELNKDYIEKFQYEF